MTPSYAHTSTRPNVAVKQHLPQDDAGLWRVRDGTRAVEVKRGRELSIIPTRTEPVQTEELDIHARTLYDMRLQQLVSGEADTVVYQRDGVASDQVQHELHHYLTSKWKEITVEGGKACVRQDGGWLRFALHFHDVAYCMLMVVSIHVRHSHARPPLPASHRTCVHRRNGTS